MSAQSIDRSPAPDPVWRLSWGPLIAALAVGLISLLPFWDVPD